MSVEILLSVNQDLSLNLTINSKAYNYLSEKLLLKLFRKIGSSVVSVSRPFNVKGLPKKKRERKGKREKHKIWVKIVGPKSGLLLVFVAVSFRSR